MKPEQRDYTPIIASGTIARYDPRSGRGTIYGGSACVAFDKWAVVPRGAPLRPGMVVRFSIRPESSFGSFTASRVWAP